MREQHGRCQVNVQSLSRALEIKCPQESDGFGRTGRSFWKTERLRAGGSQRRIHVGDLTAGNQQAGDLILQKAKRIILRQIISHFLKMLMYHLCSEVSSASEQFYSE